VRAKHGCPTDTYCGNVGFVASARPSLSTITGLPGQRPVRVGIPIDDLTAGNLLALGIMMAIYDRERAGVGRWVTTSLLEAQIFMLDFQASRWLIAKEVAPQAGKCTGLRGLRARRHTGAGCRLGIHGT
jgi:crotonobetainyl-CoA:carnitine CoA-transferase CaiB-like acyl-CoA transferase